MNKNIGSLLQKLKLNTKPFEVKIQIEKNARSKFCIPNVLEKIKKDGGSIEYGWMIRETPFLIEAIYHAVWKSDTGDYIDITPPEIDMDYTLFVIDNRPVYQDKQIDNVRINHTGNRLVDDLISLAEIKFEILNHGDRALIADGEIKITPQENETMKYIDQFKHNLTLMLYNGAHRNSPCFCGNGEKYKHCHGKKIIESILKNLGY